MRMVVPGPGEYIGIPINLKAKQYADAWRAGPDEAAGKQCEAYGGGTILLVPEQLHISWQDDNALRVQSDAGMQDWVLHFQPGAEDVSSIAASRQGYAAAKWDLSRVLPPGQFGVGEQSQPAPRYGSLDVEVSHLLPGLLRKNGVPYSGETTVSEFWEQHPGPAGAQYLIISMVLSDPVYLTSPYYTAASFEKQADGSGWDPTPCSLVSTP
jgi:hypothetical protein